MIRELLKKLSKSQKELLFYAFEQEIAQYIEFDDGTFLGVNVGPIRHLEISERAGVWACGRIRRGHH